VLRLLGRRIAVSAPRLFGVTGDIDRENAAVFFSNPDDLPLAVRQVAARLLRADALGLLRPVVIAERRERRRRRIGILGGIHAVYRRYRGAF